MHPTTQGIGFVLLAVMAWGAQFPIAAGAMQHIDSTGINLFRYGLSSLVLVGSMVWSHGTARLHQGLRLPAIWWVGTIGMAGSSTLMFLGIRFTRPEIAVLVLSLQPSMTAIAEWVMFRKRPAFVTLVCMLVAFGGLAWAVTRGGDLFTHGSNEAAQELLGCTLVVFGAAAWVFYTLGSAKLKAWSPLEITAMTCLTAMPLLIAVWLLSLSLGWALIPSPAAWPEVSWRLAFLSLVGVLAAMWCWNLGTVRLGTLNAILMLHFMPVITFVVRAAEGAVLRRTEIVGASLVIAALVANNLWLRYQNQFRA